MKPTAKKKTGATKLEKQYFMGREQEVLASTARAARTLAKKKEAARQAKMAKKVPYYDAKYAKMTDTQFIEHCRVRWADTTAYLKTVTPKPKRR